MRNQMRTFIRSPKRNRIRRGCFTYLIECIFAMSISGFLASQGENLSDIGYIVTLLAGLIVGYCGLDTLSGLLKEKFNPVLVNTIMRFSFSVAVFCAFVLCLKRIG